MRIAAVLAAQRPSVGADPTALDARQWRQTGSAAVCDSVTETKATTKDKETIKAQKDLAEQEEELTKE